MEGASEFLSRKAEERERFASAQRSDLEVRVLRHFASMAAKWKLGKKDAAEREAELRHLRELGINIEVSR